jgi:hypothetical protein
MARTRKSSPKAQAVRTLRARKKPRAIRKPADKPQSIKPPPSDALDDLIAAAAHVLALAVEPQWLPAIKANLDVNLRMAAFVAEFALPDEADPAPVFTA